VVCKFVLKKNFYATNGYIMLQFRIYSATQLNEKPGIIVHNTKMIPLETSLLKFSIWLLLVILLTANKEGPEFPKCKMTK